MLSKTILTASVLTAMALVLENGRLLAQDAALTRFERVASVASAHGNQRKLCTAFFVRHGERMYLVTAKHASLETNGSTEIGLPSIGSLHLFRLADTLKVVGADPWIVHKSADECRVVGMHLGSNADDSGAKLARFLPASVLVDFIESQAE